MLTVPSFQWVQLASGAEKNDIDPKDRISPKCQAIGEHYIFLYGGRNSPSDFGAIACDHKTKALFFFHVNKLEWTNEFTPNNGTYEIPSQVIDLIGGE